MASQQLDAYLNDLAKALTAHDAWDARTLEESRAHLLDAVEAGVHRGVPRGVAEREAIAAFGPPDVVAAQAAAERKDHHDLRPHAILDRLLAASCWCTLFATAYLTLSVLMLRPPRFNYATWLPMAGFFIVQSALTLATVRGPVRSHAARTLLIIGGVAIAATGAWWVHATLASQRFEGYALVLGAGVAMQGALTVLRFVPIRAPWIVRPD